jgi:hypothetical protein
MAKVDYLRNQEDFQAALLGSLGFSTAFIQARTGLCPSQIGYRLGKARIRRLAFRNGQSPVASYVLGRVVNNGLHKVVEQEFIARVQTEEQPAQAKK